MGIRSKINGLKEIWKFDNRTYLAFSRLLFPSQTVQLYKYRNIEFLSDHGAGDANGAREVITAGMYRDLLAQIRLSPIISVLDIGANNGGFPLLLKSEGYEIERLICVELNPNTFGRLEFNLRRNFNSRFTAINAAVAGKKGVIHLKLGIGGSSDNIYSSPDRVVGERYELETLTFDDVVAMTFGNSVVDICKMDIEGAEFEIFESETAQSLTQVRFLLIEIHHDSSRNRTSLIQRINDLGFSEIDGDWKSGNAHFVHLFANDRLSYDL